MNDKQETKTTEKETKPTEKKEEQTQKVPRGLYQKPIRRQGSPIGSRELTDGTETESTRDIPKVKKGGIRMLFFGGLGEIGKNMYGLEYEDEILILDCGLKFATNDTPGIDLIVPNVQYLEERKKNIKGIVISHAHLDHIGGISVLIDRLGNPPIFSRKLSIELIRHRQGEFESKRPIVYHEIEKQSKLKLTDNFTLNFFSVTHTIPDSMGIIVDTPVGSVVYTGDLKLTHKDGVVDPIEYKEFEIFKKRNVLLTLADSTNADRPGFSLPESTVIKTIEGIIKETKGRLILCTFSSQIERTVRVIEDAIQNGRKIVAQGRSMLTSLSIASELGILKVSPSAIVPIEKIDDYPKEKAPDYRDRRAGGRIQRA